MTELPEYVLINRQHIERLYVLGVKSRERNWRFSKKVCNSTCIGLLKYKHELSSAKREDLLELPGVA